MRVLVGCEFSGIVRDAFTRKGHYALSCDIEPTEKGGEHYQGDVRDLLGEGWDLAIFHPPCTRLCNSGVRWLSERNLWSDLDAAATFFLELLHSPIERIAIENPVMHKYARKRIGREPCQTIQPFQFGHTTSKKTCLWLKNLPLLKPTKIVPAGERTQDIFTMSPGPRRAKERSRTFEGIAEAMANQWVDLPPVNLNKPKPLFAQRLLRN